MGPSTGSGNGGFFLADNYRAMEGGLAWNNLRPIGGAHVSALPKAMEAKAGTPESGANQA